MANEDKVQCFIRLVKRDQGEERSQYELELWSVGKEKEGNEVIHNSVPSAGSTIKFDVQSSALPRRMRLCAGDPPRGPMAISHVLQLRVRKPEKGRGHGVTSNFVLHSLFAHMSSLTDRPHPTHPRQCKKQNLCSVD